MPRVLVQRYDNEPDLRAIRTRGYSDVYRRASGNQFDLVLVVPTAKAKSSLAVIARATSGQYQPIDGDPWPGRPDSYPVRIDVAHVRETTLEQARAFLAEAGLRWQAPWTVVALEASDALLARHRLPLGGRRDAPA